MSCCIVPEGTPVLSHCSEQYVLVIMVEQMLQEQVLLPHFLVPMGFCQSAFWGPFFSLISNAHTENSHGVCLLGSLLLSGHLKTHFIDPFFVLCDMLLEIVLTQASWVVISQLKKSVSTCWGQNLTSLSPLQCLSEGNHVCHGCFLAAGPLSFSLTLSERGTDAYCR